TQDALGSGEVGGRRQRRARSVWCGPARLQSNGALAGAGGGDGSSLGPTTARSTLRHIRHHAAQLSDRLRSATSGSKGLALTRHIEVDDPTRASREQNGEKLGIPVCAVYPYADNGSVTWPAHSPPGCSPAREHFS